MTTQEVAGGAKSTAWNETAARDWVDKMLRVEDVEFPWNLTANLARNVRPETKRVIDAASGPGGFLATILDAFPDATGVWFDFSATMEEEARRKLERFGDRVTYVVGDLADIGIAGEAGTFDLITTSRATHHLAAPTLTRFYQQCAQLLAAHGYVANVDSMSDAGPWRQRLRDVRAEYRAAANTPDVPTHPQVNVSPQLSDHLSALRAAGFDEIEVVWKVFVTGLLMARKIDPADFVRK